MIRKYLTKEQLVSKDEENVLKRDKQNVTLVIPNNRRLGKMKTFGVKSNSLQTMGLSQV